MRLLAVAAPVIAALALAAPVHAGELAPTSLCRPGAAGEMLCLHNYARHTHGLPPLRWLPGLAYAAQRKADAIEHTGRFEHAPLAGVAWDAYFPSWLRGEAENLAIGYPSRRATFKAWLASPEHRRDILLPWTRWYGSAFHARDRLWVVDFGI